MRPHSLSHVPIHKLSPRSHHSSINHTQIHTHALLTLNSVSHFCMDPHKTNKPHKQKEQQEISLLHKPQKQAHPVPKNGAWWNSGKGGIWREQQEEGGRGILDQQMVKHGNILDDDKRKSRKRVRGSIGVSFRYYLYTIAVLINLLL